MQGYQCPACKTMMYSELRPTEKGQCVYCNYKQNSKGHTHGEHTLKLKPIILGTIMCQICGSFREIVTQRSIYCANCKFRKGEPK